MKISTRGEIFIPRPKSNSARKWPENSSIHRNPINWVRFNSTSNSTLPPPMLIGINSWTRKTPKDGDGGRKSLQKWVDRRRGFETPPLVLHQITPKFLRNFGENGRGSGEMVLV